MKIKALIKTFFVLLGTIGMAIAFFAYPPCHIIYNCHTCLNCLYWGVN